jgi:DNA (cytosine-5)-methyltransferase 1
MKLIFADILRELKASGYKVSARLLNAMYFHVPQSRERMRFIGVREDIAAEPTHPKAQSNAVTVREAIKNAPDYMMPFLPSYESKSGMLLRDLKQGQKASDILGSRFGTVRLDPERPFPTIAKAAFALAGYSHLIHPFAERSVSIAELRRGSSFPDSFQFAGKYIDAHSRIGNSVPPLLMRSIARHIREQIL